MSLTRLIRDAQSRFEVIPGPAARFYDLTVRKVMSRPERRIAEEVARKLDGGTVLDVGSGTGFLAIEIAERAPGARVVGIDLSREMVRIAGAHARGLDNVRFRLADAAELPFDESSMDFIVSTGSMHHWRRPVKVFNECFRVLKPGGTGWIYDPCPEALAEDPETARKRYGFLRRRLYSRIARLHGFTLEEFNTRIRTLLDESDCRDHYRMDLTDIWMRVTLTK